MPIVQLVVKDGKLYLPNGAILLCVYEAGDCDTISWPDKYDEMACWSALFDAREMGDIPTNAKVLLPNGNEVEY